MKVSEYKTLLQDAVDARNIRQAIGNYRNRKSDGQLYEIVEVYGGGWMILVNGHQWGGPYDMSGAGGTTFKTVREAVAAYEASDET